jgi:serine protease AprX
MMRHFIAATIFVATAIFANARSTKIASDLPTRHSGSLEVIVQFKHRPTSAHAAKIMSYGGSAKSDLSLIKGLHAAIPANRLHELANDPEVSYISPDRKLANMSSTISFNVPSPAVDAPYAWSSGFIGSGIGVAVVDSGTQDAADLQNSSGKNRIIYKQSYISGTTGTVDVYGHGVHVAGLIAGNGKNSNGRYEGVAPNANVLNFRVLDDNGVGRDSYVISAIQAVITLKNTYNIRVLNLSLGRPVYESASR